MSCLATRACAAACLVPVHHHQRKCHADQDGDDAGHDESPAPAQILPDHAGHQRRGCHAEIAPDAVQAHLAAEPVRIGHDHRSADRMIDRGEKADRQQRRAKLQRGRDEAHRNHRRADADEEDHHHVAAAPAVAEPAGDQRARAERDEARGGVRQ